MTDLSAAPGARLFTAFGTVIYFDVPSGELRHGPVETSPTNAVYEADQNSPRPGRLGWLMHDSPGSREPIICDPEGCRPTSDVGRDRHPANATRLELIPLERGLIAFRSEGLFLCAYPDGRIALSARICSTWECFLASENWCTDSDTLEDEQFWRAVFSHFDKKKIEAHIVHPLIRARTNRQPKAAKVLIYGYTKWSHGRVYYDLSRHLHDRGYVVDILDWQVNHDAYIADIIQYYDLFMTALDGAGLLADISKFPTNESLLCRTMNWIFECLLSKKG
jgi:hypothetical protein